MQNVSINTVMTLTESTTDSDQEFVKLKLRISDETIWYKGESRGNLQIDAIDAQFIDDGGKGGQNGNISVLVKVKKGEEFVKPYVTTDEPNPNDIDCVTFEPQPGTKNRVLKLTFQEPPVGKVYTYPNIYFHVDDGNQVKLIDPRLTVRRKPL